ncbi:MAG: hypothetical protein M0R21_09845 [Lentimicrobiaceae bacterium]|nr:hypothetical protein [Lentimicrobiaceae bacterium]
MGLFSFQGKSTEKAGTVLYKVHCSKGDFNLTYKCKDEKTCQLPQVNKNWKHQFEAGTGDYVYLAAQANSLKSKVDIKIIYRGKTFRKAIADGDYAMAISSGCLC